MQKRCETTIRRDSENLFEFFSQRLDVLPVATLNIVSKIGCILLKTKVYGYYILIDCHYLTDLLEKSRVIRQAPGERCYHIFYQVFSGFNPNLIKELLLDKPLKDYWFVAQAELQIDGVDDKEEHGMTDESFDILMFSATEKQDCYRLVSAIMHMGNMKFKQRPREEQAETDGTDGKQ
jgi:hypothetical protein